MCNPSRSQREEGFQRHPENRQHLETNGAALQIRWRRNGCSGHAILDFTTLVGVGVVFGFDAGAGDEPAKRFFAASAALRSHNEAGAVNHHINRIGIGLIHGRKIGVFHHHDFAVAGMLVEVFLDGFPGFADVNREKDEAFGRKLFADFVDEGRFVGAEAAPGGPEFEERDFAFDGFVGELLSCGGCGGKVRSGFLVLGTGGETETTEE